MSSCSSASTLAKWRGSLSCSWSQRTLQHRSSRRRASDQLSIHDPTAYRSERLPTAYFDTRFSGENLAFWVPILILSARIGADSDVLDVGCGTGGFTRAIAAAVGARVTGYDRSEKFIAAAKELPPPENGAVDWVVGDAGELPFPPQSVDRVLLSLVLHQLADPAAAVEEAFRVLRKGGLVLVRTITPDDAAERVPARYIPAMAEADAARLPSVELVVEWIGRAGFVDVAIERHVRNKELTLAEQERELRTEVAHRYAFISAEDVEAAVERMRAEAATGPWVDPRPTHIITAAKPR